MSAAAEALNGICPYFTMFPLEFPVSVLRDQAHLGDLVLDPYCGRGTTNFAARLLGLQTAGIDSSPVAVALTEAKMADASANQVVAAARRILRQVPDPQDVPCGEFWELAYDREVLSTLCRLREGLLADCRSESRKALRGVLLGALHGPRPKSKASYFSNQSPRTYAPKPGYAMRFWRSRGLLPEPVDVLSIIDERATRYYGMAPPSVTARTVMGDSRDAGSFRRVRRLGPVRWVVTSPPYYGLRTYIPDQWLRHWFLGGPAATDYLTTGQLRHTSPGEFTDQLRLVWRNVARVSTPDAQLVVRLGGINNRKVDPLDIALASLTKSGWVLKAVTDAGTASQGRRQAVHFVRPSGRAMTEYDITAHREG